MRKYVILAILVLIIVAPIILITSGVLKRPPSSTPAVNLTFWTVVDDAKVYEEIIAAYKGLRPYVNINVVRKNESTYKEALLNAWARDEGPDIFSIPNSWVREYSDFIRPLPSSLNVYQYTVKNALFQKQVEVQRVVQSTLSSAQITQQYVDTVASDVVLSLSKGAPYMIYGLPFYVDNLALYFNRDLLSSKGIVQPALTWKEMTDHASRLTVLDSSNNILQSGIGLGTANNIVKAADIWSLLALQNGATMVNAENSKVAFDTQVNSYGLRALQFYTDFADFAKEVYSWNSDLPSSLDSFIQGKLAYFIGYQYHKKAISAQAPTLKYDVTYIPHINVDGSDAQLSTSGLPVPINFASYWVQTVSQKSKHYNEAWDFILFAGRKGVVEKYLELTGRVSALRSILNTQTADIGKQVFAEQALTSRSWYHGLDAKKTEEYINLMIDSVANQSSSATSAINLAAEQINQTLPAK